MNPVSLLSATLLQGCIVEKESTTTKTDLTEVNQAAEALAKALDAGACTVQELEGSQNKKQVTCSESASTTATFNCEGPTVVFKIGETNALVTPYADRNYASFPQVPYAAKLFKDVCGVTVGSVMDANLAELPSTL